VKSSGRSAKRPLAMSTARVVTPSASTFARVAGSEKRAMPQTSFARASDRVRPYAIRPAGPVIRIFSPVSNPESPRRLAADRTTSQLQTAWSTCLAVRSHSTPPGESERRARDILAALDRLLHALELEPLGADRFRAQSETGRFADRIFGGQV